MEKQGRRIVGVIRQQWKHLLDLYRGRAGSLRTGDDNGTYKDQNVKVSLAHISKVLKELKFKNYRFELYIREYAHTAMQEEKDIEEEMTLVKLLRQLVDTQITKISAVGSGQSTGGQPMKDPAELMGVADYFKRKRERELEKPKALGEVGEWEMRVRENAGVIRWQMGMQ